MESTGLKQQSRSRVSGLLASLDLIAKASAELLHPSSDLSRLLPAILEVAQALIAADAYAVWRARPDGSWVILAAAGLSDDYRGTTIASSREDIPRRTLVVEDVFSAPLVADRRQLYVQEGIAGLLVAPLLIANEVAGTVTFYFRTHRTCSADEVHLATALANLTASALSMAEVRRQEERTRKRSEFMADASAILASSLDYEATLSAVTKLAVPHIADWCAVDIVAEGQLRRVAVAHLDPEKLALARDFHSLYPPDPNSPNGVDEVIRTGRPQFFPHVTAEMLAAAAQDERHLAMMRDLGLQSVIIMPLRGREGVLGAITLVASGRDLDITDLKLAEELARRAAVAIENARLFRMVEQSERKFRTMTDTVSCGIYIHDGTRLIYVNKAAEELSGYSAEELAGLGMFELVHPDDREMVMKRAAARLRGEPTPVRYEFRGLRKNGEVRWLDFSGAMVRYDGRPALLATAFDITEQKLAQQQVDRNEKELRLLTDILPTLVAYVDCDQRYRRVNRTFEQWFQRPASHFIGQSIREVLGDHNYERVRSHIQQVLSGELVQFEATNDYADKRRHVLITYVPDFDEQRRVRGFAALVQDVSERRNAEDALRKTEKLAAVGRLAASISHEINNPLESVTNLVFLAKGDPSLPERAREFLTIAERELARVSEIATQTLRFYRQSSRPTQVDLPEMIDSVLSLYEGRFVNSQVSVRREYGQPVTLEALEGELRQVLANLIGNAIDASSAGGVIAIRVARCSLGKEEPMVRISVADSGHGVSPELRSRIFEPFFTTKTTTGTGLGLWVTREIVDKHCGSIRIRSSQKPGRSGTVFSVYLPTRFAG